MTSSHSFFILIHILLQFLDENFLFRCIYKSSSFDLFYVFQHRIFPQKSTHRGAAYMKEISEKELLCRPYIQNIWAREITCFHKCWKEKEEMVEMEILPSKIFRKWSAQASPECHLDCKREKNKNFAMRSRKVLWIIQFI